MANDITNNEGKSTEELGPIGRIIGIFTSPRETFESIHRKPTWLVPFLICVIVTIILSFLVMDITIQDRIAMMQARGVPQEQIDAQGHFARIEGFWHQVAGAEVKGHRRFVLGAFRHHDADSRMPRPAARAQFRHQPQAVMRL